MKITKKDTYGVIDSNETDQEILYCAYCSRFDIKAVLQYRQNYDATDKELWRECPHCKRVLPATSGRKASQLKGVVEPIENVFDKADITGLGNKKPDTPIQKYKEQLLKKANKEKDSEIRREILKGNIIDDYEGYYNE